MLAMISADTGAIFHGVERVVLGWNVAEVRVVAHDRPYVEVRWPGKGYGLNFQRKGKTLQVDISFRCEDGDRQLFIFGVPICDGEMDAGYVEVRIPRGIGLVAMNGKVGDVVVDGFVGDTLNVNTSILSLEIRESRISYLKARASVGSVEMYDTDLNALDSDIDIGSVEGRNVQVKSRKVKFLIGSMSID